MSFTLHQLKRISILFLAGLLSLAVVTQFSTLTFSEASSSNGRLEMSEPSTSIASASEEYAKDNARDANLSDLDMIRFVVGVDNPSSDNYRKLTHFLADGRDAKILDTVSINHIVTALLVEVPRDQASDFTFEAFSSGLAKYVEPSVKFRTQMVPNDPYWTSQWGPKKIKADWAWNSTVGNSSVFVTVIDTGVDYNHPDLAENYASLGYDWVNDDSDPMDDHGHGTHCAGIIAAVLNNNIGIAGLAQITLMAEKGLDAAGTGWDVDLANSIVHATDQGADVISMSWGGYEKSELLHEAIKYAYNAGVLLVAAAGNDAIDQKLYPAAYEEVIAVAATDSADAPASFTNYGDWIELAAPGVNIYSTISVTHASGLDYPYDMLSGTSMATPHVAGLAALMLSSYGDVAHEWIRYQMRYTADDLGEAGFDVNYGYGRINAKTAIEQPLPEHDLILSRWATPSYVKPGDTATFNITVFNFGESEEEITVQLIVNSIVVDSVLVDSLENGEMETVTCHWTPTVEGKYNVTSFVVPVLGETNVENNVVSIEMLVSTRVIALFQNSNPWGYSANQEALYPYGIACAIFDSNNFGSVDLTEFLKVVIASDQDQDFYLALDAYLWWFDAYVLDRGILEIHGADGGYNGGYASYFPAGLQWKRRPFDNVTIVNASHPILNEPYVISGDELDGWHFSVHGYFQGYPPDTQIIVIEEHYGGVALLEFSYGSGLVIASGFTLEWAYKHQYSRVLENCLLYKISEYPTVMHDVTIVDVVPSETSVYAGTLVNITVVARNEGNVTETFDVTAHCGNASIGTKKVLDLTPQSETSLTFTWDTGNFEPQIGYLVWAGASIILNEVNTTNNFFSDGYVRVKLFGDINDDNTIDIFDVVLAAQAYGSKLGDSNWNSLADLSPKWGVIDILDLVTLVYYYGS